MFLKKIKFRDYYQRLILPFNSIIEHSTISRYSELTYYINCMSTKRSFHFFIEVQLMIKVFEIVFVND